MYYNFEQNPIPKEIEMYLDKRLPKGSFYFFSKNYINFGKISMNDTDNKEQIFCLLKSDLYLYYFDKITFSFIKRRKIKEEEIKDLQKYYFKTGYELATGEEIGNIPKQELDAKTINYIEENILYNDINCGNKRKFTIRSSYKIEENSYLILASLFTSTCKNNPGIAKSLEDILFLYQKNDLKKIIIFENITPFRLIIDPYIYIEKKLKKIFFQYEILGQQGKYFEGLSEYDLSEKKQKNIFISKEGIYKKNKFYSFHTLFINNKETEIIIYNNTLLFEDQYLFFSLNLKGYKEEYFLNIFFRLD